MTTPLLVPPDLKNCKMSVSTYHRHRDNLYVIGQGDVSRGLNYVLDHYYEPISACAQEVIKQTGIEVKRERRKKRKVEHTAS